MDLEREMLSSEGQGVCIPQREKTYQSLLLSDVSEEMYNRVIWWLKGLCFSLPWFIVGVWEAGGQVGR